MKNARTAAYTALLQVDVNAGYSNIVIDKAIKEADLDQRDASLAAAIFYGVLERRITLDYIINQFSRIPVKQMTPDILEILRMACYQILYMEKIPHSAAVNEAVNMAKQTKGGKSPGFVNGVLRGLLRGKEQIQMPNEKKEPLHALSIMYSCPQWLIQLWQEAYGKEHTLGILKSFFDKPPLYARVNTTKITTEQLIERLEKENVCAKAVSWLPGAVELEQTGSVAHLQAYEEGLFHIQDISSQLCCSVLAPKPGQTIADLCAAPGGKTFTMAEQMENQGKLLSFGKYKGKVGLIRQGAKRLGLSIVEASIRDSSNPKEKLLFADGVLCDAPCAGLGIIRRKPEIRYKPQEELKDLPLVQRSILKEAAKQVKPGGTLVYSTCSLNPAENGEVADWFLKEHSDFKAKPLNLPASIKQVVDQSDNQITLLPHIHGTDGFFIAVFVKT